VKWDDSNPSQVEYQNANAQQTGVVFKQSGATATAKYKAHLASSLATATSTNSQRKYGADIVPVDEARSAICYASANQIWVSDKPISFSQPFSPEQLVSTGVGSFSQPSILVANGGIPPLGAGSETAPQVAVVYQKDGASREVWFRDKRPGQWNAPMLLGSESVDTRPVLGRTGPDYSPYLLAVWQASDGLRFANATFNTTQNGWTWGSAALVPQTSPADKNPSITCGYKELSTIAPIYVTYDNGDDVFLLRYDAGSAQWIEPEAASASLEHISTASQVIAQTPGSSLKTHTIDLVWEFTNQNGERGVIYQGKIINQYWTTAHEVIDADPDLYFRRPTITRTASGDLIMAWDNGYYATYKAIMSNGQWGGVQYVSDGTQPNFIQPGPSGALPPAQIVSMANTAQPPYAIQVSDDLTTGASASATLLPEQ
jgi:hypothetical protein